MSQITTGGASFSEDIETELNSQGLTDTVITYVSSNGGVSTLTYQPETTAHGSVISLVTGVNSQG